LLCRPRWATKLLEVIPRRREGRRDRPAAATRGSAGISPASGDLNSSRWRSVLSLEGTPMRHAVISFSFAASLTLGCAGALAQAGGGASGGSSAGGGSTGGGAPGSSGASAGVSSGAPGTPAGAPAPASGPAPDSAAVPSRSVSPTTGESSIGSTIPRAQTGPELEAWRRHRATDRDRHHREHQRARARDRLPGAGPRAERA
jgi:hypothetical protein